ncbi:PRENYLATED RAB ACCEPTOR 1-RELATED [Salix purpurea]|uniref:PRA1 family protein n=2 Tax=Salix TaxID=40685 RepID=A0A9Q0Q461_SALPP|nr:PRENYLATED RAB ACCEPTOR 1-RELATED [Salix purpurea]
MMSSQSPPVLPVTNLQQPPAAAASASQPPLPPHALRAILNSITESVRNGFAQRRPFSELIDRSAFSKPESISDATTRIRKNYSYFRINYLTAIFVILAFSLLSHPFSLLLLLGLVCSWLFLFLFRASDQPLVLFGRTFSDRETLGILIVLSIFVVFLTSVGSLIISALLVGVGIVCAHGAFRAPEDLFLDDVPENANTSFLSSFIGSAASNVVSTAAPIVAAARV